MRSRRGLSGHTSSEAANDFVVVGEVTAPHGIRGEVKVRLLTDFPDRFRPHLRLRVRKGQSAETREIEAARQHRGFVVIKFAGADSANDAEELRGAILEVPKSEAVPLQPGEYYFYQIEGLDVITTEGRRLGKVTRVIRGVASDIYEVEVAGSHCRRRKTMLVPAVREIVKSIDLERGEMTIELIPGLE